MEIQKNTPLEYDRLRMLDPAEDDGYPDLPESDSENQPASWTYSLRIVALLIFRCVVCSESMHLLKDFTIILRKHFLC